jgi:hypothetical protein
VTDKPGDETPSEPGPRPATADPQSPRPVVAPEASPEALAEVLASIRALVSSEAVARVEGRGPDDVLHLTPDMRVDAGPDGAGDVSPSRGAPAPMIDEETVRVMINRIVREELQGELGDRIGRNLRKIVRREIAAMLEETRRPGAREGERDEDGNEPPA